jgi:signal transduction histidine kinase
VGLFAFRGAVLSARLEANTAQTGLMTDFLELYAPIAAAAAVPCLIVLGAMLWRARVLRQRLQVAEAERDRAVAAEDFAIRTLRMAGAELRTAALALLGHADPPQGAGTDPAAHAAAIHAVSAQVFGLADELQDHAVPSAESRVLHVEPLRLEDPVRDAIASVNATLGRGRRHWVCDPELSDITVLADRRALSQVFLRICTNAARFSRHGDRIVISLVRHGGDITIAVADAVSIADAVAAGEGLPQERGGVVGLGLGLARVLMQAHGGDLAVVAVPRFGTCVSVSLPSHRVSATQPLATS